MGKAAEITKEIYDPRKVELLYQTFTSSLNRNGKYKEYEIKVDDFTVIPRTNDPGRFMEYADFVNSKTNCISIILVLTNNIPDTFNFYFTPESLRDSIKGNLQGLSNKEENTSIDANELIARGRKEAEYENLLKENQLLKEDIKVYQKDLDNLLTQLDEAEAKNDDGITKYIPLIQEIKGLVRPENNGSLSGTPKQNAAQSEGSFKRKGEAEDAEEEPIILNAREKGHLAFIEDVRRRIGDHQMGNIMRMMDMFADCPESIPYAHKLLTRFIQDKKNEAKRDNSNGKEKI